MDPQRTVLVSVICLLSIFIMQVYELTAAEKKCPNPLLTVEVNSAAEGVSQDTICEWASWAVDEMARCDIALERKLTIEVVDDLKHPCGLPVVGMFDSRKFELQVSTPKQCRQLAQKEPSLAKLNIEVLYGSIIVHEVIHAVFWKHLDPAKVSGSSMANEYVAYAFQILSLPETERNALLADFPRATPPVDLGPFNSTALLISPLRFATNAFRHFMAVHERCQHLKDIISGKVEFEEWDPFE